VEISDKDFEDIVSAAIDDIPENYSKKLDNIAFIIDDEPSPEQRLKLRLSPNQTLFGLYEGAPLPARFGQTKILPDKITIFKKPLIYASHSMQELKDRVGHTVWHEVAHYYGLDHKRIDELDSKPHD
jgi:predicted Zn-dependent protease with MMP-like domain